MAKENWRENPEIMAARDFAKRFDRKAVIIVSFTEGHVHSSSYGANPRLCETASKISDEISALVEGLDSSQLDL